MYMYTVLPHSTPIPTSLLQHLYMLYPSKTRVSGNPAISISSDNGFSLYCAP